MKLAPSVFIRAAEAVCVNESQRSRDSCCIELSKTLFDLKRWDTYFEHKDFFVALMGIKDRYSYDYWYGSNTKKNREARTYGLLFAAEVAREQR